jgi:hypothetical protein
MDRRGFLNAGIAATAGVLTPGEEGFARPSSPLAPQRFQARFEFLCTDGRRQVAADRHVTDFVQNFTGWVRLRLKGPARRRVTLPSSNSSRTTVAWTSSACAARAADGYILKGDSSGEFDRLS